MTSVIHGVSCFFKQISHYTGAVSGLGPCDTGVSVCVCDEIRLLANWLDTP